MSSPIIQALNVICEEKNIPKEVVIHTLEAALAAAYRKDYGLPNQNVKVEFNAETGAIRVFDVKTVMEPPPPEATEALQSNKETERLSNRETEQQRNRETEQQMAQPPAGPETAIVVEEEERPRFHPRLNLTPEEARLIKPDAQVGDEIRTELEVPGSYGRMAAQTAKQVIMQKLREAEREVIFNEFKDKERTVMVGSIGQREGRMISVDFGRASATMPPEAQAPTEQYVPGQRMKFYIESVSLKTRGAEVIVSRVSPELVRHLFMVEIPEIQHGTVEIMGVVREAGSRTKIAVRSTAANIDPVGSCVGQRGSRVQTVINELGGGERIDIIEWDEDPEVFLKHALSPAKVARVEFVPEEQRALVLVVEDQLSLAIGRGGQNVRLASRLTGWRIDIRKLKEEGREEASQESATAQTGAGETAEENTMLKTVQRPPTSEQPVEDTKENNESNEEGKEQEQQ